MRGTYRCRCRIVRDAAGAGESPFNKPNMRLTVLVLLVVFSAPGSASASAYVLKCTSSDGEPAADLIVDLDNMVMRWGLRYNITKAGDRYITAIRDEKFATSEAGGDIVVLDRVTGAYKHASIGMSCNNDSCRTGTHLDAGIYSGICKKTIL